MNEPQEQIFERLRELGIPVRNHEHPAVYTVEEARQLRGDLPGGHCKNLFLRDKKGVMALVVCAEDHAIDLRTIGETLGMGRVSFGSARRLEQHLRVIPGAVTPFAVIHDLAGEVQVVLEASMMEEELLNFHPLRNDMSCAITPEDLVRFLKACGHEPRVVALS